MGINNTKNNNINTVNKTVPFILTVVSAKNLISEYESSSNVEFSCIIKTSKEKFRTTKITGEREPVWNNTFRLLLDKPLDQQLITILIKNHDKTIGELLITPSTYENEVYQESYSRWFIVNNRLIILKLGYEPVNLSPNRKRLDDKSIKDAYNTLDRHFKTKSKKALSQFTFDELLDELNKLPKDNGADEDVKKLHESFAVTQKELNDIYQNFKSIETNGTAKSIYCM